MSECGKCKRSFEIDDVYHFVLIKSKIISNEEWCQLMVLCLHKQLLFKALVDSLALRSK